MAHILRLPPTVFAAISAIVMAAPQVGVAPTGAPDLVIHNAKVITVDKAFSIAEGVAVKDGRIVAVGLNDDVRRLAGPRTDVVDLRGRTMLPGFHDTHSHAVQMGLNLPVAMDLTTVTSIEDIRRIVARRVASAKPGEWIFSEGGWWQFMLSDKRLPTRHDLDPVSPRNPVVLRGGHYWIANSAALKQIGYTKDTPDPPGGEIWRDENGEPTGYLLKTAYRPILPFVPKPDRATQLDGVRQAIARMNSWGMTSYREAGGSRDYVDILRELHAKGQLTIRVDFSYDVDPNTPERDIDAVFMALGRPGQEWGDGMFRADTLAEVFLDGAEESGLLRTGYQGRPDYRGIQLVEQKQLNMFAAAAARHGWRPTPHAVGDAAIDQALEAFEYAHARTPITNRRWMIDHAILLQPDQYQRVTGLGLIINAQPRHNFIIGDNFIEFWGMPRAQMAYRLRDWLDHGIVLALGADRPISFRASPLMQIDIAVTRRTGWGGVLGPDQGISREEAIRAITATPAYSSFEEGKKGSIEPGKYADFVVLARDILSVPAQEIGRIEVAATVLGGKTVHGSLVR
jgi:predicted amidohydrolase YtcJ